MSTVMANRRSAARSRQRRVQYIADLEQQCRLLRDRVQVLSEELRSEKMNYHMATVENAALRCQVRRLPPTHRRSARVPRRRR